MTKKGGEGDGRRDTQPMHFWKERIRKAKKKKGCKKGMKTGQDGAKITPPWKTSKLHCTWYGGNPSLKGAWGNIGLGAFFPDSDMLDDKRG